VAVKLFLVIYWGFEKINGASLEGGLEAGVWKALFLVLLTEKRLEEVRMWRRKIGTIT